MKKKIVSRAAACGLAVALVLTMAAGCGVRFGFASDPDDPNAEEKTVPIDTSVDSFE